LIHARGYRATGIQQILDAVGIPKGSFYFYFKSKDDFGCAVIDHLTLIINDIYARHLLDANLVPLERLNKLLDTFETSFRKNGAALGCPIGNLSLELADANEELRERLRAAVEGFIAQIESCLKEAQARKQLPSGLRTGDAARLVFHGLEGAIMHMKVAKNIEPLRSYRRYLSAYLSGARKENS